MDPNRIKAGILAYEVLEDVVEREKIRHVVRVYVRVDESNEVTCLQ